MLLYTDFPICVYIQVQTSQRQQSLLWLELKRHCGIPCNWIERETGLVQNKKKDHSKLLL